MISLAIVKKIHVKQKQKMSVVNETYQITYKFDVLYITENIYSGILSSLADDMKQYVTILYEKGTVYLKELYNSAVSNILKKDIQKYVETLF